nr:DoxX family protein [uncultured Lichenicoccus sp.]
MLHVFSIWMPVVGFAGAGLFNAIGTSATQSGFVRWGYPAWWCRLTGGLEMVCALLIALPATRAAGLLLGAIIVAAAILTVLRCREFAHLLPLGAFVALLALAAATS